MLQTPDLRLDKPFHMLVEHMTKVDLEKMDLKEHSHVPYLVILYKYLHNWMNENNGNIPKTYREKQIFKELIRKGILIRITVYIFHIVLNKNFYFL